MASGRGAGSARGESLLLIVARNLGDAVISTGLISALSEVGYRVELWTRPTFRPVFDGLAGVQAFHPCHFPMGTQKHLSPREVVRLLLSAVKLRRRSFDVCVNTVGDFRENFLGWAVSPRRNVAPVWPEGHPYRGLVRRGLESLVDDPVPIPRESTNIYEIMEVIAGHLGGRADRRDGEVGEGSAPHEKTRPLIGLHPFASVPSKLWPMQRWVTLATELSQEGAHIRVYCAPAEESRARSAFRFLLADGLAEVFAESLEGFLGDLPNLAVLVGLDSFAVHAAHAVGVRSVVLSGASDISVWAPPSSVPLNRGQVCPRFPCSNRAPCRGTSWEFQCMDALEVGEVLDATRAQWDRARGTAR